MPIATTLDLKDIVAMAQESFMKVFTSKPSVCVVAPGRVNLMGDHTDYNGGFALPMALPLVTVMVSRPLVSGTRCCVHTLSTQLNEHSTVTFTNSVFADKDIAKREKWPLYIRGVLSLFQQLKGPKVPAFNAVVASSVPIGAGLSSSAALEVATLISVEELTKHADFSLKEKAIICMRAENEWAGSPCGIMDQFVSLAGLPNHAILIDCRSKEIERVKMNFNEDVKIVVVDSGVKHRIAASFYGIRRRECEEVASLFNVSSLRELQDQIGDIDSLLAKTKEALGEPYVGRLRHVLNENQRVLDSVKHLRNSDMIGFGKLMQESHASLRDDFEVSCAEVDELVNIALAVEGVYGARMTGGGFGGCIVVLVKAGAVDELVDKIDTSYSKTAQIYVTEPSNGAYVIQNSQE